MMKNKLFKNVLLFLSTLSATIFAQWQQDQRLTNDLIGQGTAYTLQSVACSGNLVHVVYNDFSSGSFSDVGYLKSSDGGLNWSLPTRMTFNSSGGSINPAVTSLGEFVHVTWYDLRNSLVDIYYKRSTDSGVNWQPDIRISFLGSSASAIEPTIAASDNLAHIAWQDTRHGLEEIYYKRSTDHGETWGAGIRLTNQAAESKEPHLAASGLNVHLVWYDWRDGNAEIYYKRSLDGGVNWDPDFRLTNNSEVSVSSSISLNGNNIFVVWVDDRDGNYEIYFKSSTDNGSNWSSDVRLTNNSAEDSYPSITVNESSIHVVWMSYRDNIPGSGSVIYYKNSTDGGLTWSSDLRLPDAAVTSANASVAAGNSSVHVAWTDLRDFSSTGTPEIYYKLNTGVTEVENNYTDLHSSYSLYQNYPNPFNPVTTIQYSIPQESRVILKVYDALGNEIATLVNEEKHEGRYKIDFDGTNLSSGMYFYTLQAGNYTQTKKLILIK
jgi:hypothetical protein